MVCQCLCTCCVQTSVWKAGCDRAWKCFSWENCELPCFWRLVDRSDNVRPEFESEHCLYRHRNVITICGVRSTGILDYGCGMPNQRLQMEKIGGDKWGLSSACGSRTLVKPVKGISFGGIPNSSIIYIYIYICVQLYIYIYNMNPHAMFDYMDHGPFLLRSGCAHVDNVITSQCSKQSHGCSCLWNLLNFVSGTYTSTRRNPLEPASGTYTSTRRNSPKFAATLQNLPEDSGTFRNLPLEPTPAHTGTCRNSPEP